MPIIIDGTVVNQSLTVLIVVECFVLMRRPRRKHRPAAGHFWITPHSEVCIVVLRRGPRPKLRLLVSGRCCIIVVAFLGSYRSQPKIMDLTCILRSLFEIFDVTIIITFVASINIGTNR